MASSPVTVSLIATPVKSYRRTRPSFSPRKQLPPLLPSSTRAASQSPEKSTPWNSTVPQENLTPAHLLFEEFSFETDNGGFRNISEPQEKLLLATLEEKYGELEMQINFPFLILYCKTVPDPEIRPFMIAGCVAVWRHTADDSPADLMSGAFGGGEPINIDPELSDEFDVFTIPSATALLTLKDTYFKEAVWVSYLADRIVIEYPEIDAEDFKRKLNTLPMTISNCKVAILFSNGFLAKEELGRKIVPQPKSIDGAVDYTDYMALYGFLQPGTIFTDPYSEGEATFGVQVEKDGDLRVTVPMHAWDQEIADLREILIKEYQEKEETVPDSADLTAEILRTQLRNPAHFKIGSGNKQGGTTHVGHTTERLGESDIGLVTLEPQVEYSNRFLTSSNKPLVAKKLLSSREVKFGDVACIDSPFTGFQQFPCMGIRVRGGEGRSERFLRTENISQSKLPLPGKYVACVQGVYAVGAPEMHKRPYIREGVCGSALLRIEMQHEKGEAKLSTEAVLDRGEIMGFMHWTDLRPKTTDLNLWMYCETTDPLINDGWEIRRISEKHGRDELTPEIEERRVGSPVKKGKKKA